MTTQTTTTFVGVVGRNENLFRETKSGGSAGGNQAKTPSPTCTSSPAPPSTPSTTPLPPLYHPSPPLSLLSPLPLSLSTPLPLYPSPHCPLATAQWARGFAAPSPTTLAMTVSSPPLSPSPPPHTHDCEPEGRKETQRRTGAKITSAKITDAKTTRRNFTDAIRDDAKG